MSACPSARVKLTSTLTVWPQDGVGGQPPSESRQPPTNCVTVWRRVCNKAERTFLLTAISAACWPSGQPGSGPKSAANGEQSPPRGVVEKTR